MARWLSNRIFLKNLRISSPLYYYQCLMNSSSQDLYLLLCTKQLFRYCLKRIKTLLIAAHITLYTLLKSHQMTNLEALKRKWETDLEGPISEPVWQKFIQRVYSSSVCLRHAVVHFKIDHRKQVNKSQPHCCIFRWRTHVLASWTPSPP